MKLCNKWLMACITLCAALPAAYARQQAYPQYEKEKAIIFCMTREYVLNYQDEPAEEDLFPECETRFLKLQETVPYEKYKAIRDKGYMIYQDDETTHILNEYYGILTGQY
ncbi:MAG: hypothetical protein GX070_02915 [Alcaligenaceae bacterium]|nr:hypothetical protein [Alcaligenaceae bacterium]